MPKIKKENIYSLFWKAMVKKPVMAIKKEEISTILLGKHALNNTFIIYSNGTYARMYDRSIYAMNQTENGIVSAFSNHLREKILLKCNIEHRAALEELFSKHPPAPEK